MSSRRRAWRLSRRIAGSARNHRRAHPGRAASRGADRREEAAIPDRRHAGVLRRRRSRAHPGRAEEAAARARRLQRRAGAGTAAARMRARAGRRRSPASALLALGRLAEQSRQRRERLRPESSTGWRGSAPATRGRPAGARSSGRPRRSAPDEGRRRLQHERRRREDHDRREPVVSRCRRRPADAALGSRPAGSLELRVSRAAPRAGFGRKSLESGQALPRPSRRPTTTTWICCRPTSRIASSIACSTTSASRSAWCGRSSNARPRLRCRVPRLPGRLLAADGRSSRRPTRCSCPTIPTVLSLRMVARLIKWADRSDRPRSGGVLQHGRSPKTLHRRACEWSREHPEVFLRGQVPYASIVEQMAVRRMPLAVFAPRDLRRRRSPEIWSELETRLQQKRRKGGPRSRDRWGLRPGAIESLIARLESAGGQDKEARACTNDAAASHARGRLGPLESRLGLARQSGFHFVHSFDTDGRDLARCGYVLELHERNGSWLLVTSGAHVQIDRSWAFDILSGTMSPLVALERRIGRPAPPQFESVRMLVGGRGLQRIDSRLGESESSSVSMTTDVEPPSVTPRVSDGGDVDLLHRHHGLEGTLRPHRHRPRGHR